MTACFQAANAFARASFRLLLCAAVLAAVGCAPAWPPGAVSADATAGHLWPVAAAATAPGGYAGKPTLLFGDDARPMDPFAEGATAVYLRGARIVDIEETKTFLGGGSVAFSYSPIERLNLGINLSFLKLHQKRENPIDQDAFGVDLSLFGRYRLRRWGRLTLFAEGGFGLFTADRHVPGDGTEFNLSARSGAGLSYPLARRLNLEAGVTYFRMSNIDTEDIRFLGMNGAEFFVDLARTF